MTPIFSLLHPSARPHKWREIYEAWMGAADQPQFVEYLLCADERWGFMEVPGFSWCAINGQPIPFDMPPSWDLTGDTTWELRAISAKEAGYWTCHRRSTKNPDPNFHQNEKQKTETLGKVVWNTRRRCYVDAVNIAAEASTGRILIVIADDQYPCDHWDTRLLLQPLCPGQRLALGMDREPITLNEFVVSVSTGTPLEHERGIMVMPILSRARYERKGYVFFPEYESAFSDNDFYSEAVKDKCIIDARHLVFPHRHPLSEPGAWDKRADGKWIRTDEVYAQQNREEAYKLGERIFSRRFGFGFGTKTKPGKESGGIALALPGEEFSHVWVAKLLEIIHGLLRDGLNYCPLLIHTSEPGITRATIVNSIKELNDKGQFSPEFILWMDDDQIVEYGQVSMLMGDAHEFPDADMICGWTWIASSGAHVNEPQVSCGRMDLERGELSHAEYHSVQSADGLFEVGWSGFPLVLMRPSALEKVGKHPFSHYPCPRSPWGECGEDISFCKRLTDAGGKIYVDSRVFVPHLKLKALGPVPDSKEQIELALTGSRPEPPLEEKMEIVESHARTWLELHKSPSAAD